MSRDNILVGLTGAMASGKSTVSRILQENFKVAIIDADAISWELSSPSKEVWRHINEYFGRYFFNEDMTINRKKFGTFIFNDPEAKKLLESFSHPPVIREIQNRIVRSLKNKYDFIVVDAPLLIEVGLHKEVETVVVVDLPKYIQIERLAQRNNFSEEEAEKRINTQISREERLKHANYVIDNSLELEDLKRNVIDTFNLIKERSGQK